MDIKLAADHYREFCNALDIDISLTDTKDTPKRVAKMFANEFTLGNRAKDFTFTTFPVEKIQEDQLVNVVGIEYVSLCRHHHLSFSGEVHLCYLPDKKLAGLSKLSRLVKWISMKPSVQETLIGEIVAELVKELDPKFVGVSMTGKHSCMSCRGVRDTSAITMNTKFYMKDKNKKFLETRAEFESAINKYYLRKAN